MPLITLFTRFLNLQRWVKTLHLQNMLVISNIQFSKSERTRCSFTAEQLKKTISISQFKSIERIIKSKQRPLRNLEWVIVVKYDYQTSLERR